MSKTKSTKSSAPAKAAKAPRRVFTGALKSTSDLPVPQGYPEGTRRFLQYSVATYSQDPLQVVHNAIWWSLKDPESSGLTHVGTFGPEPFRDFANRVGAMFGVHWEFYNEGNACYSSSLSYDLPSEVADPYLRAVAKHLRSRGLSPSMTTQEKISIGLHVPLGEHCRMRWHWDPLSRSLMADLCLQVQDEECQADKSPEVAALVEDIRVFTRIPKPSIDASALTREIGDLTPVLSTRVQLLIDQHQAWQNLGDQLHTLAASLCEAFEEDVEESIHDPAIGLLPAVSAPYHCEDPEDENGWRSGPFAIRLENWPLTRHIPRVR